jgi:3-methylcrotonyl-CoA carboxylase alpha subunit
MIAKLIAHAPTRAEALATLTAGLDATVVTGLKSNRAFLARLASDPVFGEGTFDTGFIPARLDQLVGPQDPAPEAISLAAAALAAPQITSDITPFTTAFRLNLKPQTIVRLWHGETLHSQAIPADAPAPNLLPDGRHSQNGITAYLHITPQSVEIRTGGHTHILSRQAPLKAEASSNSGQLLAPMPGRVLALDVAEGDKVETGQRLAILEAMKMEHQLKSPATGTISKLAIAPGDQVAEGMLLLEIS